MDIYHYRATWPLPPHKQEEVQVLARAIVGHDWDALFNSPCPGLPVLPEEVFKAWIGRQTGTFSVSRVRPSWRAFLRRSAISWEKYEPPCSKYRQLISENLMQLWPGVRNKMDTPKLRITQALIDASRTS